MARRNDKLARTSIITYGHEHHVRLERTKEPSFANLFVSNRFDAPSPLPQQSCSSLMQSQDSQASHNNKPVVLHIINAMSLRRGDRSKALSTKDQPERKHEADLHEHSEPMFSQYTRCELRSTVCFSFISVNCQILSRSQKRGTTCR